MKELLLALLLPVMPPATMPQCQGAYWQANADAAIILPVLLADADTSYDLWVYGSHDQPQSELGWDMLEEDVPAGWAVFWSPDEVLRGTYWFAVQAKWRGVLVDSWVWSPRCLLKVDVPGGGAPA